MNNQILLVLLALIIKHFFADFPLQNLYMLGKGKSGTAWIMPLSAHCGVHALFSLVILCLYNPIFWWLAIGEFGIHFVVDRIKATAQLPQGVWVGADRGKNLSKYYFYFGLDQLAHSLTYVGMIYVIINF